MNSEQIVPTKPRNVMANKTIDQLIGIIDTSETQLLPGCIEIHGFCRDGGFLKVGEIFLSEEHVSELNRLLDYEPYIQPPLLKLVYSGHLS